MVTGGASGIGRACALAFAEAGADIALVDRNNDQAIEATIEIKKRGVDAVAVSCDVGDEADIQKAMKQIIADFGRLDIALNSAGIAPDSDHLHQSKSEWDSVLAVNLSGLWLCAQAQVLQMTDQKPMGGKIINIASAAAQTANFNMAYCTSKAGVVHLSRSLAAQLGGCNININTVSPGLVMSPIVAQSSLELRNKIRSITPMGYIARPEDITGAVLFLASSAADFITGQDLLIDGGRTLTTRDMPVRKVAPRVSIEEELVQVKADLDRMGVAYTDDVVVIHE